MTPAEIGQLVTSVLTGSFGIGAIVYLVIQKRLRTPADENDSIRLGNEFLRGLLDDARKEREELRKTIDELRDARTDNEATILRLQKLLASKDERIEALESLLERITEKLHRGEHITLEDVLGSRPLPEQSHVA